MSPWWQERIVIVGAVELWESRSDFQGAVGRVENHSRIREPGTAAATRFSTLSIRPGISTALL